MNLRFKNIVFHFEIYNHKVRFINKRKLLSLKFIKKRHFF